MKIEHKIEKYLNEKFMTAFKLFGHDTEVFENPSKKEFKELSDASRGVIRFFINFKTKKVIMWNGNVATHGNAAQNGVEPKPNFNYNKYALSGKDADIIFGGTLERGYVLSDSWDATPDANYPTPDLAKNIQSYTIDNVNKMAKNDFSWLDRYNIDGKRVKELVDSLVTYFDEDRHLDGW